jgi:hypothetical protein
VADTSKTTSGSTTSNTAVATKAEAVADAADKAATTEPTAAETAAEEASTKLAESEAAADAAFADTRDAIAAGEPLGPNGCLTDPNCIRPDHSGTPDAHSYGQTVGPGL